MAEWDRTYLCIDLKSFYASAECVARGLDPMTCDLVVADPTRSEKTICLAVSPSLKAKGVRNRCRVFEIPPQFSYIMAPPRMQHYINTSAEIYGVYLSYIAKQDIHVYSIDEAFMDVTSYLPLYGCSARELADRIRAEIMAKTGIPATAGIGSNLYLAKVALDITAKHSADMTGILDEASYRATLWDHTPLTDFWRVGRGTQRRLAELGLHTMGDVALYPNTEKLYTTFGIDAELLIDHAWGIEPVTMADIKAYKSQSHSLGQGQVLMRGYSAAEARIVMREMADALSLDLTDRGLVAEGLTISVGHEKNEVGWIPPHAHATAHFPYPTDLQHIVVNAALEAFDSCVSPTATIRRMQVYAFGVQEANMRQMSLFEETTAEDAARAEAERVRAQAMLSVKKRFGKNALVRGTDLQEAATQMQRNAQIGGHKSGTAETNLSRAAAAWRQQNGFGSMPGGTND